MERVTCDRCGAVVFKRGLKIHNTTSKCLGTKRPRKTQREVYEVNKIWRKKNRLYLNKQRLGYYYKKKSGISNEEGYKYFSREVKSILISFE